MRSSGDHAATTVTRVACRTSASAFAATRVACRTPASAFAAFAAFACEAAGFATLLLSRLFSFTAVTRTSHRRRTAARVRRLGVGPTSGHRKKGECCHPPAKPGSTES
jgi:hypothetical protein